MSNWAVYAKDIPVNEAFFMRHMELEALFALAEHITSQTEIPPWKVYYRAVLSSGPSIVSVRQTLDNWISMMGTGLLPEELD